MADAQYVSNEQATFVLSSLASPRNFDTLARNVSHEYGIETGEAELILEGMQEPGLIEIDEIGFDRRCYLTDTGKEFLKTRRR